MLRTFNNGIGLVAAVPDASVPDVTARLRALGEDALIIGEIAARKHAGAPRIRWVPEL